MPEKVCFGVISAYSRLSYYKGHSSLIDETWREGICDNWVPFGGPVFRQMRGVQKRLSLHLLFFKCLQLKIICQSSVFWSGMSWTPTAIFWGGVFCYTSFINSVLTFLAYLLHLLFYLLLFADLGWYQSDEEIWNYSQDSLLYHLQWTFEYLSIL